MRRAKRLYFRAIPLSQKSQPILRYLAAVLAIIAATALLEVFHNRINSTTVALAFILIILLAATFLGRNPALLLSLAAMLCFNYFFSAAGANVDDFRFAKYRRLGGIHRDGDLEEAFERASETEALRRSERLKSALLDAVTHDLRTPLTAIKASVTTLLESQDEREKFTLDAESQGEFLSVINEETDRLNDFIGDMVELARIEAGALNLRNAWSEVPEIIQAALSRAEPFLADFKIKILLEENLPLIRVDSKALAEVLYNLLENAAKYSAGKSNIEISVKRDANERLEFAVADEGRGIPENLREKIFDKFFRISQAEEDTYAARGTGLGLAIAKGIVEAHGGVISVGDGANKSGAKFIFTVPIGDEN